VRSVKDDEKTENWWQRFRPTNATLVAYAGVIAAIAGLISALNGCSPS
jgi:hypothetical protein